MQAGTTSPRLRASDIATWLLVSLGVGLLVLLLLSFALESKPRTSTGILTGGDQIRIAYFEFGITADTLWLANPVKPSQREKALVVPHAHEFGVIPSISPDGRSLVYTALAANDPAPAPDSPAGLWLASISRDAQPRLLVSGVDLRVAAVWTPDGANVVYRRSDANGFSLATIPIPGGEERILAHSNSEAALFPVGFSPDGSRFYHVALSEDGSRLYSVVLATRVQTELALLSPGLTREWSLSKDGSRLAFLAMNYGPDAIAARAYTLDLASGALAPVTSATVNAFGPIWDSSGALLVGSLNPNGEAALVRSDAGSVSLLPGPGRGFDVPLGFAPAGGAFVVRAFSGATAVAPGAATLTLIDEKGGRHVVASGDVTFVGWSTP